MFLNSADDNRSWAKKWLIDTHLKGLVLPEFLSFEIVGNEDCPQVISLYNHCYPTYMDEPVAIYIYNSETGEYDATTN